MTDRMFLAVALDDESRHAVAAHLTTALGKTRLPGRVVPAQNWHITLRFLGAASPEQSQLILRHLDAHLMVDSFRIRIGGLGGFPRERKASVLWMGVDGDTAPLAEVAAECERAAVRAGLEPEGRPFHPHLTLSRIRPPADVRPLIEKVEPAGVPLDVAAVMLYRSILGSGPARYEVVDTVPF